MPQAQRKTHGPLDRRASRAPVLVPSPKKRVGLYEDPLQHLWAVSYSDLLMVLMSFFIIFFSMSDTDQSALKNVLIAVQDKLPTVNAVAAQSSSPAPGAPGTGGIGHGGAPVAVLDSLAARFQDLHLPFAKAREPSSLTINLPDDLYKPGSYALPQGAKDQLKSAFEAIRPYAALLTVTFVGHSDAAPFSHGKGKVIDSNLVLSNLRATRAVEFALTSGFDPKQVVAQGAGEHSRNTRSLSMSLSERRTP